MNKHLGNLILIFVTVFVLQNNSSAQEAKCKVTLTKKHPLLIECQVPALTKQTYFGRYFHNITNEHVDFRVTCTTKQTSTLNGAKLQSLFPHKILRYFDLRVQHCNLTEIKQTTFTGMDKLQKLSITHCPSLNIETDSFCCISLLTSLALTFNNFVYFPSKLFTNLSNLKLLYIGRNKIRSIEKEIFQGLDSLEELYLHDNQIYLIENGTFLFTPNLSILSLRNNKLNQLTSFTFYGLNNMFSLTLTNNNISLIDENTFQVTPKLEKLYLGRHFIYEIHNNTFCNLPNLYILTLIDNKLTNITSGTFCKSSTLVALYLARNHISFIADDAFSGLQTLIALDLNKNPITNITNIFGEVSQLLRSLALSFCDIEFIPQSVFAKMTDLGELGLQNNKLKLVESETFQSLVSMQKLNLKNNFIQYLEESAFGVMRYLNLLDLSNNSIKIVYPNLFSSRCVNPFSVDFSHNNISIIKDNSFSNINVRLFTNFSGNNLVTFRPESLGALNPSNTHNVDITNNMLKCDCKMVWIKNGSELESKGIEIFNKDSLTCYTKIIGKSQYEKRNVAQIPFKMFFCKVPYFTSKLFVNYTCPPGCSCFDNYSPNSSYERFKVIECLNNINLKDVPFSVPHNLTHLLIHNNQLTRIKQFYFQNCTDILYISLKFNKIKTIEPEAFSKLNKLIYLDISYNNLGNSISTLSFIGLSSLEELYLGHSRIKNIKDGTFTSLTLVRTIDLSHNELQNLNYEEFSKNLRKLEDLRLTFNNWNCDCIFGPWFSRWIIKWQVYFIHDAGNISCYKKNYQWCETILIVSLSTSLGFVIIIAIVSFLIYYNRERLLIALYGRCRIRLFRHEEPPKRFDAFMSHCSKDDLKKMKYIDRELAKPPHYLKLCIHQRDWLAGVVISENIIQSVKNSRRAIIMMTENYVNSPWCQFEFQVAHTQFLEDKSFRLIVVLANGTVPETDDVTINRYLKTHTYLDYTSEHFWNNLRYAMPEEGLGQPAEHVLPGADTDNERQPLC